MNALRITRRARAACLGAVCALAASVAACDERATTESERVVIVEVTPSSTTVPVGTVMTLTAEPRDAAGHPVRGQQVFWSSSDTTVAVVSNAGVVSARGSGEAQIAATAQGISAVATIRVSDAPPVSQSTVARVVVSPPAGVVRASGAATFRRLQLTATAYDAENRVVSGVSFTWSADKNTIATVDGNGLVVGLRVGEAVVTATAAGISGSSEILVLK